jgi:hypothetical protein
MRIIAAVLSVFLLTVVVQVASAQTATPAAPAEVRELLRLLNEPGVRSWLTEELKNGPTDGSMALERPFPSLVAERLVVTRARLDRLGAALPGLPEELSKAAAVRGVPRADAGPKSGPRPE